MAENVYQWFGPLPGCKALVGVRELTGADRRRLGRMFKKRQETAEASICEAAAYLEEGSEGEPVTAFEEVRTWLRGLGAKDTQLIEEAWARVNVPSDEEEADFFAVTSTSPQGVLQARQTLSESSE